MDVSHFPKLPPNFAANKKVAAKLVTRPTFHLDMSALKTVLY